MGKRVDALWRIWALVWQATIGYLALIIISTVALIWMVIDLLWQLILGTDALDSNSTMATHVSDAFYWSVGQTIFSITGGGDGSFRWFWTS